MSTAVKVNQKFKDTDDLKVHLQNQKSSHSDHQNLYKHVGEVMNYIVSHVPQDGLNKLEEISFLTKNKDVIKTDDFLKSEESRCYAKPADKETKDATAYGIEESSDFFKIQMTKDEDGNEVPADNGTIGFMPDLLADQKMW